MGKSITRRGVIVGAVASVAAVSIVPDARAAGPTVHEVKIKRFKFDPKQVEVKVGDTIRWINEDLAPHTATADERGWDTDKLEKDDSAEIVVSAEMETSYFCLYHRHMKGTITILS